MNDLNTNPLCNIGLSHGKSSEFNHSDKEFDEVLEDGLKLNDKVKQLDKQIEIMVQDNLDLVERNKELEAENSKLKAMLAKAQVDFLKSDGSSGQDMVNEPPHYKQHAMECFDEMLQVFGAYDVMAYCKCAAWKYRYRAPYKGKFEEDNAKADWYLKNLKKLSELSTGDCH